MRSDTGEITQVDLDRLRELSETDVSDRLTAKPAHYIPLEDREVDELLRLREGERLAALQGMRRQARRRIARNIAKRMAKGGK